MGRSTRSRPVRRQRFCISASSCRRRCSARPVAPGSPPLADRFGRVRVMVLAATFFGIGAIGSSLSWGSRQPSSSGASSVPGRRRASCHRACLHRRGRTTRDAPPWFAAAARHRVRLFASCWSTTGSHRPPVGQANHSASPRRGAGCWPPPPCGLIYGALSYGSPSPPATWSRFTKEEAARAVLQRFSGVNVDEQVRRSNGSRRRPDRIKLRELRGPRFGLLPIVWTASCCPCSNSSSASRDLLLLHHPVARRRILESQRAADERQSPASPTSCPRSPPSP